MGTVNDRVALLINKLGITKTKFSEQLNVSTAFISQICSGARLPSDRTIADICREFNVSEAWLRNGDGEMFVTRTMNQELAVMFNELLTEPDESVRKRWIAAILDLPPEFWHEASRFLKKLSRDGD